MKKILWILDIIIILSVVMLSNQYFDYIFFNFLTLGVILIILNFLPTNNDGDTKTKK